MRWWIASSIVTVWLAVVALAQSPWLQWENAPGAEAVQLKGWPEGSTIPRDRTSRYVLMFVHPQCPCTRTSLRLLEQAADLHKAVQWRVVAWRPRKSDWRPETTLPVFMDEGGAETKRFGVTTSGHVLSLDSGAGVVLFSGGLTNVRGSSEAGMGFELLQASLRAEPPTRASSLTFGCSLVTPE